MSVDGGADPTNHVLNEKRKERWRGSLYVVEISYKSNEIVAYGNADLILLATTRATSARTG